MDFNVQYITNQLGEKQAVVVPIAEWLLLQKQLKEVEKYTRFYDDISESMYEVMEIEKGNKIPQTLTEFLDDC